MTQVILNSAASGSPCAVEAKSAAPVRATPGAAFDARGYLHGKRPDTWLISGLSDRMIALHALSGKNMLSFREIAKKLSEEFHVSITRSAVIGRAKRIHLPHRTEGMLKVPKALSTVKGMSRVGSPRKRRLSKHLPRQVKVTAITLEPAVQKRPGKSLNLTIYELHTGVCHWPYGNNPPFKFCGRPALSGQWCPEHRAIVYVRQQQREVWK